MFDELLGFTPPFFLLLAGAVFARLMHAYSLRWVLFAGTYTMNWARAFGLGDGDELGHTWSLAVEEQFYILWPPTLFAVLNWRPKAAPWVALALAGISLLLGIILHLSGASLFRTYNGFDTRASELLAGCAAAFLTERHWLTQRLSKLWFIPVLGLAAAIFTTSVSPILPLGGFAFLGLMGAWLVVAIRNGATINHLLQNPTLVYLGRISYSIYLWHYLILSAFGYLKFDHRFDFVIETPIIIAIAAISYHFVEQPILEITKRRISMLKTSIVT